MSYLRVSIGTWTIDLDSDRGREIFRRIRDEGLQVFRQQPGFLNYHLMKMSGSTTVAVAEWESRELGQQGARNYRAWLRDSGIMEHLLLETYDGDVVVSSQDVAEEETRAA